MEKYDVIIAGAGTAGLFCANFLARYGNLPDRRGAKGDLPECDMLGRLELYRRNYFHFNRQNDDLFPGIIGEDS